MRARVAVLMAMAAFGAAQNPPPVQTPPPDTAPGGVFRLPPVNPLPPEAEAAPKTEEPKKPVMEYAGKPIRIPFDCTEEMIHSFAMTCTERDPCPVYAEIAGFQPLGQKLFLTGNFHNGAFTMFSLFLQSDNGGRTWTEPIERIPNAGLDRVLFFDLEAGWISGHLLQTMPRDPFFMITTDGGKNWRRRPVFDEPRIGAIEKFWFESRTSGSLLFDRVQGAGNSARYERFETMTGGDTWMIREVSSKPLQLKGARDVVANPDWRLRADPATRSHIIEQRQDGRWQRVAAFLVQVAECRPEFHPLTEPPAPPEPAAPETPATPARPRSPSLKKP
jgi:hypothetical protein